MLRRAHLNCKRSLLKVRSAFASVFWWGSVGLWPRPAERRGLIGTLWPFSYQCILRSHTIFSIYSGVKVCISHLWMQLCYWISISNYSPIGDESRWGKMQLDNRISSFSKNFKNVVKWGADMFAGQQHLSQLKEQVSVFLTHLDLSNGWPGFLQGLHIQFPWLDLRPEFCVESVLLFYYFHFLFVYFKSKHDCTHIWVTIQLYFKRETVSKTTILGKSCTILPIRVWMSKASRWGLRATLFYYFKYPLAKGLLKP